jgi:dihydrofolate synthase/folylpolyglutamate synthase
MRRLLTVLGSPQERFEAIHVVGTNGKSSTVRMCAALLEAHGVRTGAFLSPHLISFAERIRIGDADLDGDAFAAAIQRAAAAAAKVDRTLEPGDRVTQFELVTAAAFDEFARQNVEVAVVEAGLGGRHDATNVINARTVVLTNVGLEHTRWLGPTIRDIAREKLAVVHGRARLVVGELDEEAREEVRRTTTRITPGTSAPLPEALSGRRPEAAGLASGEGDARARPQPLPGYQRKNFQLAMAAAREQLGELDEARVISVANKISVPGRMQRLDERTILDGAHNPSGMEALAEALPDTRLVAVVSILDDKDAAGMLRALLGKTSGAVFTRTNNPRALPPATLASLAEQLHGPPAEVVPDPHDALSRARQLAGPEGTVVATGSIYLVADLLGEPGRRRRSAL